MKRLLLVLLLAGCTKGEAPLAPGECIKISPDSAFTPKPGGVYCVTIRRDTTS
jgi:hypothetical protein